MDFSSNAKGNLTNGESSKKRSRSIFNQPNTEETVSLHIVMGNELDTIITKKFHVQRHEDQKPVDGTAKPGHSSSTHLR